MGARAILRDPRAPDPRAAGLPRVGARRVRAASARDRGRDAGHVPHARRPDAAGDRVQPAEGRYARDLALALNDGFDLPALETLTDDEVRQALTGLRGIGRWTADVYLTMCLLRPDVWPNGDQALATGAMELLDLPARPTFDELAVRSERWRPYRAVAARIIWHHYLGVRGRLDA